MILSEETDNVVLSQIEYVIGHETDEMMRCHETDETTLSNQIFQVALSSMSCFK